MPTVTLQMSFDSSYIDFNLESQEKFLHKVSLLSVGNSYLFKDDFNPSELEIANLAENLLPYKHSEDRPTHLRAWHVIKTGSLYEAVRAPFDFEVKKGSDVNQNDLAGIKEYYKTQLKEQISNKEHLEHEMKTNNEIEIDEKYVDANKVKFGKAFSITSQMSQKLFPFNEALDFLFLSGEENIDYHSVLNSYNEIKETESIVFFPVSPYNDNSVWFSGIENRPEFIGELARLNYPFHSKVSNIDIKRAAFSIPTKKPNLNYDSGNVQFRKDGRYVGEVTIAIEQDNDWKVHFNKTLAYLLDVRDSFIDFITPDKVKKYKNLTDNFVDAVNPKKRIDEAIQYFLNPFFHIPDYVDSILEVYNNNAIAKSGFQDIKELEALRADLDKKTNRIKENIGIFKPDLVDVLKLADQFAKEKNAFELHLKVPIDYEADTAAGIKSAELFAMLNQLNAISNEGDFSAVFFTILLKIEKFKDNNSISLDLANKSILAIKGEGDNKVVTPVPIESPNNINLNSLWHSHILQNDKDAKNVNLLTHLISKEQKPFDFESISGEIIELHHTLSQTYANLPVFVSAAAKNGLKEFILDRLKESYKDNTQPTNDQVPLRIQIGKSTQIAPVEKDDLLDELSGYVLLSARGVKINDKVNFKDWKHHNWVKADININSGNVIKLESPFLVPGYLPVENDIQKIFLEISNEKPSLAASIKDVNQGVTELTNKGNSNITYYLDKEPTNHNPYGLLYGYWYDFAGAAILNSGVLPEVLRDNKKVLNKFKESLRNGTINKTQQYHYLRTKKIPAPGVKINNGKGYPKQLNPLYFELYPEEQGKKDERCNKLIVVGENFNSSLNITVERPRTSFWDCYSFLHDGIKDVQDNIKAHKLLNPKEDNLPDEKKSKRFIDYFDAAVSDFLRIEIVEMHTMINPTPAPDPFNYKYEDLAHDGYDEVLNLIGSKKVFIKFDKAAKSIKIDKSGITLKPGTICSVKIYNLVETKYFDSANPDHYKFHKCIYDLYDLGNAEHIRIDTKTYYKIAFDEHIIETALAEPTVQNKITPQQLWEHLVIDNELPFVSTFNDNKQKSNENSVKAIIGENSEKYRLYSRVDVQHQKWEWNGRQLNVDATKLRDSLDPSKNPDGTYSITEAMKFEAWAFSERPDYASTKTPGRILASFKNMSNIVHEYKNVIDNHCMYLRYAVQIFNRYELLGPTYQKSIKSEIPLEKTLIDGKEVIKTANPWKRHLKLSKREVALPTPAVRFYIPLTNSIEEANEVSDTADMMLVLDDVQYKEAGLAQILTLGIRKGVDPNTGNVYPEAGYDPTISLPIITTEKLTVNKDNDHIIVPDSYLNGPFGFTFDFNATNSKINSSSYIISGKALSSQINKKATLTDAYWPMFKLSVRYEMIPKLFNGSEEDASKLTSNWSSSQWVQFMKAVDSFIPTVWRKQVRQNGFVNAPNPIEDIKSDLFDRFGETFWKYHNWYLIFSKVESNIGGLPIENYYNTFIVTDATLMIPSLSSVHLPDKEIENFDEGYVRIMVVRKSDDYAKSKTSENIWEELFGKEKENGTPEEKKIKEDNTLAMPILSERIPIRIKK
jgi:hypothetical protein